MVERDAVKSPKDRCKYFASSLLADGEGLLKGSSRLGGRVELIGLSSILEEKDRIEDAAACSGMYGRDDIWAGRCHCSGGSNKSGRFPWGSEDRDCELAVLGGVGSFACVKFADGTVVDRYTLVDGPIAVDGRGGAAMGVAVITAV
jgi:hypothetical protein